MALDFSTLTQSQIKEAHIELSKRIKNRVDMLGDYTTYPDAAKFSLCRDLSKNKYGNKEVYYTSKPINILDDNQIGITPLSYPFFRWCYKYYGDSYYWDDINTVYATTWETGEKVNAGNWSNVNMFDKYTYAFWDSTRELNYLNYHGTYPYHLYQNGYEGRKEREYDAIGRIGNQLWKRTFSGTGNANINLKRVYFPNTETDVLSTPTLINKDWYIHLDDFLKTKLNTVVFYGGNQRGVFDTTTNAFTWQVGLKSELWKAIHNCDNTSFIDNGTTNYPYLAWQKVEDYSATWNSGACPITAYSQLQNHTPFIIKCFGKNTTYGQNYHRYETLVRKTTITNFPLHHLGKNKTVTVYMLCKPWTKVPNMITDLAMGGSTTVQYSFYDYGYGLDSSDYVAIWSTETTAEKIDIEIFPTDFTTEPANSLPSFPSGDSWFVYQSTNTYGFNGAKGEYIIKVDYDDLDTVT